MFLNCIEYSYVHMISLIEYNTAMNTIVAHNLSKHTEDPLIPSASPQAPCLAPKTSFQRLSPRMALQLAAPHTWPASIMPVLTAVAAASVTKLHLSILMVFTLLFIAILMQAAVNTFNDYYDYIQGTDSASDNVDPSDAVLLYHRVNPRSVALLAIGFLVGAFALGSYVIVVAGWLPLLLGICGALVVVLYSAGKMPISHLPLGELASGFVMGGLIPLACYQALTHTFELKMLLWAVPTMLGVGLIMFTNNLCDIEKDRLSHRYTLAVTLNRDRGRVLYHIVVGVWLIAIIVILAFFFPRGLVVIPFMLLATYPLLKALLTNPLTAPARIAAMGQVCGINIVVGAFYATAIITSSLSFSW